MANVFVLYSPGSAFTWWNYGNLPSGWTWIGKSLCSPDSTLPDNYTEEEQFSGPRQTEGEFRVFMTQFFETLVSTNVVNSYTLVNEIPR